ncbi:multicopper oxidase family protein [Burkholderiaceae bacterium FT117]|uniref:multicopper oxidase family protein n=1 Tax=Zeimonas sediminis TaxID=2944268 RepID=UPI002342C1D8|nr:multicopper oxidase family protein [Zeimonas sediminis]MCM5569319.1 multicopper oxidase family protein [Zeimonas sediminis]
MRAAPGQAPLVGSLAPPTEVWQYDGQVPGPLLRLPQGGTLAAVLDNALPEPTTIHWHGIRVPNAMDGVPGLTQAPVAPGARFDYRFAAADAGTYWYHPHLSTPEQVDRGLHGVLIVDEPDPPAVDRDIVWLLDDWRLDQQARIVDDFLAFRDVSHAGRIGNTVTINGRLADREAVRPGERIRLRLVNAANARIFGLRFEGLAPWLLTLDGQPLPAPRRLAGEHSLMLGPGMRADLLIDIPREGGPWRVLDVSQIRRAWRLVDLVADRGVPDAGAVAGRAAGGRRDAPRPIAPNPHAEPDLRDPLRVSIDFGGGMMGRGWPADTPEARAARRERRLQGHREADPVWSVNGHAHLEHGAGHGFEFVADRGRTVLLEFHNDTAWWHPIHLHGHSWRELERDGRPVPDRPWRDTSLMAPGERLQVAFVADNPGDWLLHCHVLEHHAGGMGTQFRVR